MKMEDFKKFSEYLDNSLKKGLFKEGVYISIDLDKESNRVFKDIQKTFKSFTELEEELHCTIIYSKKPCICEVQTLEKDATITAKFKGYSLFGSENDILVAEIESKELRERYEYLMTKHDFISDYREYKPHITLAFNYKDKLDDLPTINTDIILKNEVVKEMDTNKGKA